MRPKLSEAISAALALILGVAAGRSVQSDPSDLTFMSVGQGDCTVFRTAGATVLIDVGPASADFDAGRQIVVPKLREMGVASVDWILLTHPDLDHVGGLKAVRAAFPRAKVAISAGFRTAPKMLESLRKSQIDESEVMWLHGVVTARIGPCKLAVDCPPVTNDEPDNDGCLFVKLTESEATAVLTGDAPIAVENALKSDLDWRAEILKVGHHGSRTSCGDAWLSAVRPEYAVVSCGLDNRYGHPNRETELRIGSEGARELRTDLQGDIRFDFDGKRFVLARPH